MRTAGSTPRISKLRAATSSNAKENNMLDHVFISVSDINRSIAFYEIALAPLGIVHAVDYDGRQGPAGHPELKEFGANDRDGSSRSRTAGAGRRSGSRIPDTRRTIRPLFRRDDCRYNNRRPLIERALPHGPGTFRVYSECDLKFLSRFHKSLRRQTGLKGRRFRLPPGRPIIFMPRVLVAHARPIAGIGCCGPPQPVPT